MEHIEALVIGAGVIGLACARELAQRGISCVILERHDAFGTEISARNSEVIHSGIYYSSGSLKARLCVKGNQLLYAYCATHGVGHQRCGKLVVSTSPEQGEKLSQLLKQGEANGVTDLQLLSAEEACAMEPELNCTAALLSPSTGIIDSHALMLALLGDAETSGALLIRRCPLIQGQIDNGFMVLEAGIVINAAGLEAQKVTASLDGFPAAHIPPTCYAKGSYYSLGARAPFSRLVYPLPEPGGLGVHLTLDLAGQARFGPDVEWVTSPDYDVDPSRADRFYKEVRRYWPGLRDASLSPAYAGVRPKICGSNSPAADFMIQGPEAHGVKGLVNLFGIESPGLTSCLSIAEHAVNLVC